MAFSGARKSGAVQEITVASTPYGRDDSALLRVVGLLVSDCGCFGEGHSRSSEAPQPTAKKRRIPTGTPTRRLEAAYVVNGHVT
jgi:hypothetical protein